MKLGKIHLVFIFSFLRLIALQAQTDSLLEEINYTQKDFFSFMKNKRVYAFGIALSYDWRNFPNAANKQWMSMQNMGISTRGIAYPLLLESVFAVKSFSKVNSSYQIPTFQSIKINKYQFTYSISLSVFPLPYIPVLKRIQEYISPYTGIGYQWENLNGSAFDGYDQSYIQLNLSSWHWKVGCNLFLKDFVPLDLFVEYVRTLNPDKIRNYEQFRVGITFCFSDIFKSISNKFDSKPLIYSQ